MKGEKGPSRHLALHVQRPCEGRELGLFGELRKGGCTWGSESGKERGRQGGWEASKELTGWSFEASRGLLSTLRVKGSH